MVAVISTSGSLDLEDLYGVRRPNWLQKGPAKAAVASVSTQFQVLAQRAAEVKNLLLESVLGVAGSSPGWTSYSKTGQ